MSDLRAQNAVRTYMWATMRDSFQLLSATAKKELDPVIEVGGAIDAVTDFLNQDKEAKCLNRNVMNMWDVFPAVDLFYKFNDEYSEYFPAHLDDERNRNPEYKWCSICQKFWSRHQMVIHIKE